MEESESVFISRFWVLSGGDGCCDVIGVSVVGREPQGGAAARGELAGDYEKYGKLSFSE